MMFKKVVVLSVLFLLTFSVVPVRAETLRPTSPILKGDVEQTDTNAITCSTIVGERDFQFISPTIPNNPVPGQKFNIRGAILNKGLVVVDNAEIYLVIKKGGAKGQVLEEAIAYVKNDQSFSVWPGKTTDVVFNWDIPRDVPNGKYHIEFLVVTGKTKVIPIVPLDLYFSITDSKSPNNISLLDANLVSTSSRDRLLLRFKNNGTVDVKMPITVRVYSGSEFNGVELESRSAFAVIKKGTNTTVEVPVSKYGPKARTLIVDYMIGFDYLTSRAFDFKAASDYPSLGIGGLAQLDGSIAVFGCINDATFSVPTKIKLNLQVLNSNNEIVKDYSWERYSTSTAGAAKISLATDEIKKINGSAKVVTSLYKGDSLIEKVTYNYSCGEEASGDFCDYQKSDLIVSFFEKYKRIIISLLSIAVFLLALGFLGLRKTKKGLFSIFFGLLLFLAPQFASAQTWQELIKDNIHEGSNRQSATNITYDTGIFSGIFYASYPDFVADNESNPWSAGAAINRSGNITGSSGTLESGGTVYNIGRGYDNYSGTRNFIDLPLWSGWYIIDPNVEPVEVDGYGYTQQTGSNWWGQGNGYMTDALWEIPIGTRIGFYVSPHQTVYTSPNNHYFRWGKYRTEDFNMGEFSTTLPELQTECLNDSRLAAGSIGYGSYVAGTTNCNGSSCVIGRSSNQCATGGNSSRNLAMRLEYPQVSITGLDNFACEPIQSDGTMECEAVSAGTSDPQVTISSITGKIYGATTYKSYRAGRTVFWYQPFCSVYESPPYDCIHTLAFSDLTQLDSTPVVAASYTGQPDGIGPVGEVGQETYFGTVQPSGTSIVLPEGSFRAFGRIRVAEAGVAPTAPVIQQIGSTWSTYGDTSYLFQATTTDQNTNEGYNYEIDWNNDGTVDEYIYTYDCYDTATTTCVRQPGYRSVYTGYGESGYSKFEWDTNSYYGEYQEFGQPLRFDKAFPTGSTTFKVRAVDNTGLRSGWTSYTVNPGGPPQAPQNLDVSVTQPCGVGATLSWDPLQGADGAKIYRYSYATSEYTLIATTSTATTTYYDIGADQYPDNPSYMVTAYSGALESAGAQDFEFGVPSCDALLPPDLYAQTADQETQCGGYVYLYWTEGFNAEEYRIEREVNGSWVHVETVPGAQLDYLALGGKGAYESYRVLSVRDTNEFSDPSYTASAYGTASCFLPNPPLNVSAVTSPSCGWKVTFNWDAPATSTTPTGYYIYKDTYWGLERVATTTANPKRYTLTVPDGPYEYVYAMTSYNEEGESAQVTYANEHLTYGYPYADPVYPSTACVTTYQCSNDSDDDGDGTIDWNGDPRDEDCTGPTDNNESAVSCAYGDLFVESGQSRTFYSRSIAPTGNACTDYDVSATCSATGVWEVGGVPMDTAVYSNLVCRLNADVRER